MAILHAAAENTGIQTFRTISAASNNATVVKGSPGQLYGVLGFNINAAARYLKIYDKATAPAPNTDAALLKFVIPLVAGTGATPTFIEIPTSLGYFASGIGIAIVTGIADNDNTATAASEQMVHLMYR